MEPPERCPLRSADLWTPDRRRGGSPLPQPPARASAYPFECFFLLRCGESSQWKMGCNKGLGPVLVESFPPPRERRGPRRTNFPCLRHDEGRGTGVDGGRRHCLPDCPHRMMNEFSHRAWSRRLRRLAVSLCLAAMTAQVGLSGLHAVHETANLPLACASPDSSPSLRADVPSANHGARHDPGDCPACRSTSELKALVLPLPAGLPTVVLAIGLLGPSAVTVPAAFLPRDLAARAPPFLA